MTGTSKETYQGVSGFSAVCIDRDDRPDGTTLLRNAIAAGPVDTTLPERLRHWASRRPDQIYLSEFVDGAMRAVTYAEALAVVRRWSARLSGLGLDAERPLAIVAANGIDHALLMLAATSIGIPVAVVTPAYVQRSAAPYTKFAMVAGSVSPGLVVTDVADDVAAALDAIGVGAIPVRSIRDLSWLEGASALGEDMVRAMERAVGPDSVAKLLLTSGSTGSPKPVINTQRMMVSNMQALATVWTFLNDRPPALVDWLPWSHTFGGNCCFNLALYFGGSFHVDSGKPLPALVGRTVETLRVLRPSVYFNVPAGFEALLPFLESDEGFARHFFSGLDFLFNAGAALPAATRRRMEAAAQAAIGRSPPIIGAWGSTETAPFSTVVYFDTEHASNLGVPLPGVDIKLVPFAGRSELRVRGPNVMPGYWRQPEATAAAFDEEGFYRIGDAGRLADPDRPEAGILFDGRVAENFKLVSGTWVRVGALRLAVIAASRPLISDVVVAGEGRESIGLLIFPNEGACRRFLGEELCATLGDMHPARHPLVIEQIQAALREHNQAQQGGSTRIARFAVLTDPPDQQRDEITEKGYINQRAVLSVRAAEVEALYVDGHAVESRSPAPTEHFDVLIVGAGHAGAQVAIALRQSGFDGTVGLLGDEPDAPYERPPLSKDYLLGKRSVERLLLRPPSFWESKAVDLRPGRRVVAVDAASGLVTTDSQECFGYGDLVWAAGGRARLIGCEGGDLAGVHTVRTRGDVDRLKIELGMADRVVVIGGGYIGLEAAAVLTTLGKQVTLLETQDRVLARVAGEPLSRFFEAEHRARGVDIHLGATVERLDGRDGRVFAVQLADGRVLPADIVLVGIGIVPEVEPLLLAGAAGENGVDVDSGCRTSLPRIYAAGDCTSHENPYADGARIRLESVQNANDQAIVVARRICGQEAAYAAAPWFWSEQFDLRLQTIGLSAGHDDVVVRGDPALRSFSLVYLKEGRVRALDCVNATRDYVQGKALVTEGAVVAIERLADASTPLRDLRTMQSA